MSNGTGKQGVTTNPGEAARKRWADPHYRALQRASHRKSGPNCKRRLCHKRASDVYGGFCSWMCREKHREAAAAEMACCRYDCHEAEIMLAEMDVGAADCEDVGAAMCELAGLSNRTGSTVRKQASISDVWSDMEWESRLLESMNGGAN